MELATSLQFAGQNWAADLSKGTSLAIPLDFENPQPNCFRTPPARREPWHSGDGFVGSTQKGGSCNVDFVQLIPHCNGSHTESIAHITNESIWISEIAPSGLLLGQIASVTPALWKDSGERYSERAQPEDSVITASSLRGVLQQGVQALILRTLPNVSAKRSRDWSSPPAAPYLTLDAVRLLVELGVNHLLLDVPSLDRSEDGGQLLAHHEFWQVAPLSRFAGSSSRRSATISEMIFVPDRLKDGLYLLSLQVAAWQTDAAPCNPIVYPLHPLSK